MKSKILLVFDLDETLIYATDKNLQNSPDFELPLYKIYKRPGLDNLMSFVFSNYDVGFWSSASNHYVNTVLKHLINSAFKPLFIWGRSRCTFELDRSNLTLKNTRDSNYNYIKKLSKVSKLFSYPINQILIMDDTAHKSKYNPENAILIEEWKGDRNDMELVFLEKFLASIYNFECIDNLQLKSWKEGINF